MVPETRYAKSGGVNIACQMVGKGPLDLVVVPGWVSNIDLLWRSPRLPVCTRLASFSRLLLFDKRGIGLSDRVSDLPNLETRMDDVRAVMDAVGWQRTALFGYSEEPAKCWCRAPSRTWSRAPGCRSASEGRNSSKAYPASGGCSPSNTRVRGADDSCRRMRSKGDDAD